MKKRKLEEKVSSSKLRIFMKHIKKFRQARIFVVALILIVLLIEILLFLGYAIIYPTIYDANFDKTRLEMHIIPSTVTRSSVSVKLVNHTDYEMMYGESYRLERYVRGQWRDVGLHMSIILIGYRLPPNSYSFEERSRGFWLSNSLRRRLSNGRYRIIKDVSLYSEPMETIQVAAEFTIKRFTPN